jgi:hypothetical protein
VEIKIYRNADREMALKKIVWRSYTQRKLILIALIIVTGFAAVALAIASKVGNFWKFETCLGITTLAIGLLRLFDYLRNKSNYFGQLSCKEDEKLEITINDNEIIYEAEDFRAIFQWHYYKFYSVTNELLLLKNNLNQLSPLIIAKSELSQKDLLELTLLLERKYLRRI